MHDHLLINTRSQACARVGKILHKPMIKYEGFQLDNGLEVLVHEDPTTEMAVMNLLYKVGSRNEVPGKTGLAHFFEHLMFGGSRNVPVFDREVERVGGES